ncbi:MAG: DUF4239 domain-containing protein [Candidatus Obscuribacterales bacterium]|nr:DUF4239 domain-containing protein [Candidatus Obscuribacterales bacterium]
MDALNMNTVTNGFITTIITIGLSVMGLLVVRHYVRSKLLKMHHDVADPLLSVVGTLFAVLLGFMVANSMTRFEEARVTAQSEASAVGNIFRAAAGLPDKNRTVIQHACEQYVDLVINEEWPVLSKKHTSDKAWKAYDEIWMDCVKFVPSNDGETNMQSAIMGYLGVLGDARRMRVGALHNGLPPVLWFVLFAGGTATIAFTYFFGIENIRLQILMTSLVSLSICLNLFLLACYDDPFSGDVMLHPTAFENIRDNFNAIEHPGTPFLKE